MDSLKSLIIRNLDQFPDFEYYIPIIEEAERNQQPHPDIAIECCLSLIQGISKTIILFLDPKEDKRALEKGSVVQQFKNATKLIQINNDVHEHLFPCQCATLAKAIGELRNARGDISHGRAVPKIVQSDLELSRLVMEITESLLRYTLASFFAIALEELAQQEEVIIRYEDNPEFNDSLDELYPYEGKLLYSQALYQLYYEDYEIQLQAFLDEQEILNEEE